MKICITSNGPGLDSFVDPRFGRCLYFIFVDSEDPEKFKSVKNAGINAVRGAGIQAAQTVVDQGAEVVISGNFGPNAFGVLSASRVKIFQAMPSVKARDALDAFKQGQLLEMTQPFGGGLGPPPGGSLGGGRGFGRGAGAGGGRGRRP